MSKRRLKHGSGREMSPALLLALGHPLRREILRLLHGQEAAQSPTEFKEVINAPLTIVSYHARVLSKLDVIRLVRTRPSRGSTQHFYVSTVADNKQVAAILASTEEDDKS